LPVRDVGCWVAARIRELLVVLGAIAAIAPQAGHASTMTLYGTDFDVVYDPSQLGLFGTPQLIGDYLVFTPNSFDAQSLNGAGQVSVTSLAQGIQLVANPGYTFGNLSIEAVGDYLMQGPGTSVGVSGSLTATDDARPLTQTIANLVVNSPMNVANGSSQNWVGTAAITNSTPTVTPGYNPWLGQASTIDIQLYNALTADTTAGDGNSQAFIQEKFGSLELIVDPIPTPVPSTLVLLATGLAGFVLFKLSRRQAAGSARS
jgi:hypothetical protein